MNATIAELERRVRQLEAEAERLANGEEMSVRARECRLVALTLAEVARALRLANGPPRGTQGL